MTRQRKKQLENMKNGLCQACSRPKWLNGVYCEKHARRYGGTGKKLRRKPLWQEIDWDLTRPHVTCAQIAKQMGVSLSTVIRHRKLYEQKKD